MKRECLVKGKGYYAGYVGGIKIQCEGRKKVKRNKVTGLYFQRRRPERAIQPTRGSNGGYAHAPDPRILPAIHQTPTTTTAPSYHPHLAPATPPSSHPLTAPHRCSRQTCIHLPQPAASSQQYPWPGCGQPLLSIQMARSSRPVLWPPATADPPPPQDAAVVSYCGILFGRHCLACCKRTCLVLRPFVLMVSWTPNTSGQCP